jgi:hypothetical protein
MSILSILRQTGSVLVSSFLVNLFYSLCAPLREVEGLRIKLRRKANVGFGAVEVFHARDCILSSLEEIFYA